ncbi:sulfotransferase 1A3-like [Diadema antillarum]|uniref:sulfotransferase 1A3-like n=1 Tax=Diadema antillarum TaxID=105358 RepID=UPI003A88A30C
MAKEESVDKLSNIISFEVPPSVLDTCYEYRGVVMPNHMSVECMRALENFEVRPDDTFVISYPKAGTHWLQQILLLVRCGGDMSKLGERHMMTMVPFLDMLDVVNYSDLNEAPMISGFAKRMPSPRILKSHGRSDWLPAEIRTDDPKVKVIYVARNPKDTAVSLFHFCLLLWRLPTYESWDIFIEEYMAGRAPFGSWFENVLPWWARRNHPNVLFVKYEDMKRDHRRVVEQVAQFMGESLSDDVIDGIVEASTFSAMKESQQSNPDTVLRKSNDVFKGKQKSNASFMRKGSIGDWKNYFSEDQNRRFDQLYAKRMADSDLMFQFE